MTWTLFWDMHSGGGQKLDWGLIFIEAPEAEAASVFYTKFRRDPHCMTCSCCGDDYAISESPTLEEASGYHRGLRFVDLGHGEGRYLEPDEVAPEGRISTSWRGVGQTLDEWLARGEAKVVWAFEITDAERTAEVPRRGYIWVGDDEDE